MDPYSLDHIIYYSFPIYVKEQTAKCGVFSGGMGTRTPDP
jgi:hypothetical protein